MEFFTHIPLFPDNIFVPHKQLFEEKFKSLQIDTILLSIHTSLLADNTFVPHKQSFDDIEESLHCNYISFL